MIFNGYRVELIAATLSVGFYRVPGWAEFGLPHPRKCNKSNA